MKKININELPRISDGTNVVMVTYLNNGGTRKFYFKINKSKNGIEDIDNGNIIEYDDIYKLNSAYEFDLYTENTYSNTNITNNISNKSTEFKTDIDKNVEYQKLLEREREERGRCRYCGGYLTVSENCEDCGKCMDM